jgi:hypothetical protein
MFGARRSSRSHERLVDSRLRLWIQASGLEPKLHRHDLDGAVGQAAQVEVGRGDVCGGEEANEVSTPIAAAASAGSLVIVTRWLHDQLAAVSAMAVSTSFAPGPLRGTTVPGSIGTR